MNIVNCKNIDSCIYRYNRRKRFFPSKFEPHRMLMESILEHKRGSSRQAAQWPLSCCEITIKIAHRLVVSAQKAKPLEQHLTAKSCKIINSLFSNVFFFFSQYFNILFYFPYFLSHPVAKHLTMYCGEKVVICRKPSEASRIAPGDLHYLHQHVKCCIHYQDLDVQAMKDK